MRVALRDKQEREVSRYRVSNGNLRSEWRMLVAVTERQERGVSRCRVSNGSLRSVRKNGAGEGVAVEIK